MVRIRLRYKFTTLLQMSWGDRWVVAQSFLLLPVIAFSLTVVGLPTTQRYLTQLSLLAESTASGRLPEAKRIARAVNQAANHSPLWGNCLKRSLALWFLLRRRGILSDLRIGVRKHEGEFQAHAWIEYEGAVLNDQPTIYQLYSAFKEAFDDAIYCQRSQERI